MRTDASWERFGKHDPYFGVLSDSRYKSSRLTEEAKEEFFRTGSDYVRGILSTIHDHIDAQYVPVRALDFGCGVGRIVVPLAAIAQEVVGVDVSPSMLAEARRNCAARSIHNVTLVASNDDLDAVEGSYDFIHSFIVFQHIPTKRGEIIFQKLLAHLADGGVCVSHFTYANARLLGQLFQWVKRLPLGANVGNLLRGRQFTYPQMEMNSYNLNRLLGLVQKNHALNVYCEFTDHGGHLGVQLYFKKRAR